MTKYEYLIELAKKLEALNLKSDDIYPETRRLVGFYQEMIEDRMEDGISEEEAVAGMEEIDDIVARVRREFSTPEIVVGPDQPDPDVVGPDQPEREEAQDAPEGEPRTTARAEGKYTYMTKTFDEKMLKRVSLVDQNHGISILEGEALELSYVDGPDGHYEVEFSGGRLSVRFIANQWSGIRSLFGVRNVQNNPFTLTLPKGFAGEADLRTTNGAISVLHAHAGVLTLRTSNGRITAEDVAAQRVKFATSNGGINLMRIAAKSVVAESSNARIEAESIAADEVVLKTSNGANEARSIAGKQVRIETNNGHVKVDDVAGTDIRLSSSNGSITGTIKGRLEDYAITSRTSNGKNNLPVVSEGAKKLDARTSNARIDVQFVQ